MKLSDCHRLGHKQCSRFLGVLMREANHRILLKVIVSNVNNGTQVLKKKCDYSWTEKRLNSW